MPKFVSAQYVQQTDLPPPNPQMLIRAVDDEGNVWWHTDDCTQGDWLRFIEEGNQVMTAEAPPP